jgi:endonuclease/exonuclease/phosphatase family metal-dependent hydrolase
MKRVTILTANIAYGFPGMDRLYSSIKHQLHVHGWGALTYEFFPTLRGKMATVSERKRTAYILEHRNLEPTIDLIRQSQPDVLVLNEAIYELYREELEATLGRLGFRTMAWGVSTHYPGTRIATLVASREQGEPIQCKMPQRPSMGGGAGMAGIRLPASELAVFGVHLTYRSPGLFKQQLRYIAKIASSERRNGRDLVLAGDWNEPEAAIVSNPDFASLDLMSGVVHEDSTCPTFLPSHFQKALDHIFIPRHWQRGPSKTLPFGSDHLALIVEVGREAHQWCHARSPRQRIEAAS